MPLHWRQVRPGLDPTRFTLRTAPALLRKGKPWEGYGDAARSLADAIRSVTRAPGRPRNTVSSSRPSA
jgi:bifunctional non-homologous end joining protein LigD